MRSHPVSSKGPAEVLYDFIAEQVDIDVVASLVFVQNGQRVFVDVIRGQLKRIEFGDDGSQVSFTIRANKVKLSAINCVGQSRSFGRSIFVNGGWDCPGLSTTDMGIPANGRS
jgi:hypothetical protein